jgi:hypothetical protein
VFLLYLGPRSRIGRSGTEHQTTKDERRLSDHRDDAISSLPCRQPAAVKSTDASKQIMELQPVGQTKLANKSTKLRSVLETDAICTWSLSCSRRSVASHRKNI